MTVLSADDYAGQVGFTLEAADLTKARSIQSASGQVGVSDLGGCREKVRRMVVGCPRTDSPDTLQARVGTYIDAGVKTDLQAQYPDWLFDVRVNVQLPNGSVVPGTGDWADPDEPSVTDLKGLALDTPLPTPTGWTTMGAVQVGDQVFGSDGYPCTVTAKSAVKNIGTYIVRFRDGASIVCDREHLWWVRSGTQRPHVEQVLGIEEIAATSHMYGRCVNHRVPVAAALQLPSVELPLSPYVLGCWLGDGSLHQGLITKGNEMFAQIEAEGFEIEPLRPRHAGKAAPTRTVYGLRPLLRAAGVMHHKHVPDAYLRASFSQRLALVQGLMDSDGTWNTPRSRAVFNSTSKELAEGMFELLASLGQKPRMTWHTAKGFGLTVQACAVEWTPVGVAPFRTPHKAERVTVSERQELNAATRTITSVEPGPDVSTACIGVDSRNSTYLCGREMVPTHNTKGGLSAARRMWAGEQQPRFQRHLVYEGLRQQGVVPAEGVVRNYVVDRSGKEAAPFVYQEPFDPGVVAEASAWLDDALQAVKDDTEAPKDRPRPWCRSFCEFYTACRAHEVPSEAITSPRLAELVDAYGDAKAQARAGTDLAEALRDDLTGLTGHTARYSITSTWINKGNPHWRVEVTPRDAA
jgi:hypothetical protein